MSEIKDGQELVYGRAMYNLECTAERQYKKGYEKYGVHLSTFNGRDPAKDAFEEMIDMVQYVQQLAEERDVMAYLLYWLHENVPPAYRQLDPADVIHEYIMEHGKRVAELPPTEK